MFLYNVNVLYLFEVICLVWASLSSHVGVCCTGCGDGELGVGSAVAEGETTEPVLLDTSIKNIESTAAGGQEGSLDVVEIAWMHAVVGGLV